MLDIKTNMMAQNATRNLRYTYSQLGKSVERLASGQRINSAKDDAAGLAVRELIRADVSSLQQGARNARDGVSMVQAAEGALGQINAMLVRMRQLCEQANTDTYSPTQKNLMQKEFNALASEISRVTASTDFNNINLLDNANTYTISLGAGRSDGVDLTARDMSASALGVSGTKESLTSQASVPTTTSNFVALANTTAAMLTIQYTEGGSTNTGSFPVTGDGSGTALSLQKVVDLINSESRGVDSDWNAAEIVGNASDGYSLKLTNIDSGDGDLSISVGGGSWHADAVAGAANIAMTTGQSDYAHIDGSGVELDITAASAPAAINAAIEAKDDYRAELGYKMNRMEAAANVLDVQSENLLAAESRISNADVAVEMTALTRNQVLAQAGVSMLSQANGIPQMALKLLQG